MGQRILVLDDDALFRTLAADALSARGYEVSVAQSGAQADKLLQTQRPDLLVVDGLLPDTSGMDWLARHRVELASTPVFFVSAFWKDAATRKKLLELSLTADVVAKPVDAATLADRIDARLSALASSSAESSIDISEDPPPITTDETELLLLKRDAARLLSARARELENAIAVAEQKPIAAAVVEVRVRCQKLTAFASLCSFDEVAEHARTLDLTLGQWKFGVAPPAAAWLSIKERHARMFDLVRSVTSEGADPAGRTRVLIAVTDDEATARQLKAMIPRTLCTLLCFSRVEDALLVARGSWVDAVLIDGGSSDEVDPSTAVDLFRSIPGSERLPMSFLAGGDTRALLKVAKQKGMRSWIARPLARDPLLESVCSLMGVQLPAAPRVLTWALAGVPTEELTFTAARFGLQLVFVDSPELLLRKLRTERVQAVMIDCKPPIDQIVHTVRTLRTQRSFEDLPVLVVAAADPAARVTLLEEGADDVLLPGTDLSERMTLLLSRVSRQAKVKARAAHDSVTGLPSRRWFLEAFGRRLADARRRNQTLTLGLIRVEGQQSLADSNGLAAEAVLATLARRMEYGIRTEDLRGVWDASTLALVLLGATPKDVERVATRACMGPVTRPLADGSSLNVVPKLTIRAATFPADGRSMLELFQVALKPEPIDRSQPAQNSRR